VAATTCSIAGYHMSFQRLQPKIVPSVTGQQHVKVETLPANARECSSSCEFVFAACDSQEFTCGNLRYRTPSCTRSQPKMRSEVSVSASTPARHDGLSCSSSSLLR